MGALKNTESLFLALKFLTGKKMGIVKIVWSCGRKLCFIILNWCFICIVCSIQAHFSLHVCVQYLHYSLAVKNTSHDCWRCHFISCIIICSLLNLYNNIQLHSLTLLWQNDIFGLLFLGSRLHAIPWSLTFPCSSYSFFTASERCHRCIFSLHSYSRLQYPVYMKSTVV